MSTPIKCELYCAGTPAIYHQLGWWPDTFACAECKPIWDELCKKSPGCRWKADWHIVDDDCDHGQFDRPAVPVYCTCPAPCAKHD